MPTGYTAKLCDEDISFQEFAMTCAKAMGACISMREESLDAPIPDRFQPSKYHLEKMQAAESELDRITKLSDEECATEAHTEYSTAFTYHTKEATKDIAKDRRLKLMLIEVRRWEVPTSDHQGLKDLMIEQIESTIKFDCGDSYHADKLKSLRCETPEEWRAVQMAKAKKDIDYHHKAYIEEVDRVESRNKWIKQLRESLEK